MFSDIGAGICFCQKAWEAQFSRYDLSKVKKYKPKTEIPNIIQECLTESNYKKYYKWQHEKKFISNGINFEIIKYDIETGEYCFVLMEGKEVKITKRCLREWWEGKSIF